VGIVRLLTRHHAWWQPAPAPALPKPITRKTAARKPTYTAPQPATVLRTWLSDREVQTFLNVNRYRDVLWYNKEAFEELVWWMFVVAVLDLAETTEPAALPTAISTCYKVIQRLQQAEAVSDYQVEKLVEAAQST
jgi:hypothetical protein